MARTASILDALKIILIEDNNSNISELDEELKKTNKATADDILKSNGNIDKLTKMLYENKSKKTRKTSFVQDKYSEGLEKMRATLEGNTKKSKNIEVEEQEQGK